MVMPPSRAEPGVAKGRAEVALIGAGMIARTHVAALSAAREVVRLRAVVSTRPGRARYLEAFYEGEPPVFTDSLSNIAADPAIDFAIVATPPSVRKDVIAKLAGAGKHILLEKPVGRTVEEAEEVVAICERAGVTLGVVFQHRMRAPSIAVARLVAGSTLGQLGLIEITVPLWRDQTYYDELGRGTFARDGGGVMLTNAIHSLDLALSLTGPVTRVRAMTATTPLHRMEAEDFAVAGFDFACGAVGSFVASTAMFPHRTEVIRLHYDKASLRIDKNALEVSWRDGRTTTEGNPADGDMRPLSGGKHEWHQAVIENFIDAIRTGRDPMVTGRAALVPQRLIAAIEASSREGRPVTMAS